ncbi:TylF/MycF/NovP-related O-methyltransferase [Paenibacillus sp. PAMC21692]|uniref:TylF/MycF/NovP-related O-methyltransferase n=1 Tax=Paenibacillus sp. PAMC21692 TaxID=2762320 RepID=UPI00164DA047|nr:TylF/MycF/NovP-related O-methyltransferase [Paenibacillus sp. PAMC21692]QNK58368.1 class I SAM-dependent methyltransferase [Paenibacillus sp. PAMC21692]
MLYNLIYDYCAIRYSFLKTKKLFIFGAGQGGRLTSEVTTKLGLKTEYILDNDEFKWGQSMLDLEISSPLVLNNYEPDECFVLVVLTQSNQVAEQLNNLGFNHLRYDLMLDHIENNSKSTRNQQYIDNFRNINLQMKKIALKQTAEFVIDNMLTAKQYENRYDLMSAMLDNDFIEGSILEFGVFEGASINYIADHFNGKTVYGFDSFKGLPEDWIPGNEKGTFSLTTLPKVKPNVKLVEGWFDETIPLFKKSNNENCAFIHIDCDLYSSTKTVFEQLRDRIVSGTIIVFDEYFNYPGWKNGEHKAFIELIGEERLEFEYIGYVVCSMQVAVRIL